MGGNIFNKTAPIKKEHIEPTLKMFIDEIGVVFPKAKKYFNSLTKLGSVGKKDYSGDIDLAMPEQALKNIEDWGIQEDRVKENFLKFKKRARTATDKQLIKRAVITEIALKIEESNTDISVDLKGSGSGTLFFAYPQYDENLEKQPVGVQIDINLGDVDWLSFAYYSSVYKGNVKGLHRTQLMLSMFSNKGYTFSHNYGVKNRETGEIEADTIKKAVQLLSKVYNTTFTEDILSDYFTLMDTLKKELPEQEFNNILDIYLKILDRTRADIPEDLQKYWVSNQGRLGLTGKFLPEDSKLYQYKTA